MTTPYPPPPPPYAPPPPPPASRPSPWRTAAVCGTLAYVVLVVLAVTSDTGATAAFRAGRMLPLAIGATVVAGVLGLSSGLFARWWAIAAVVGTLSALGYLALVAIPDWLEQDRAEDRVGTALDPPTSAGEERLVRLTTPRKAGDLTRLDDPAALDRRKAEMDRMASAPGSFSANVDTVFAEYEAPGGYVAFRGFNGNGEMLEELSSSPERSLVSFLDGAGLKEYEKVDPGELGGVMVCSDAIPGVPDALFCGWADAATIGQVVITVDGLDLDGAAALTRDLRDAATRR